MLWFYSALFYFNSQPKLTIKTQWCIKIIAALIQKKTKKKEMEKHVWQLTQSGSTQSQKAGASTDETISPGLRDNRYKEWSQAHTSRNRWLQSHQKNFK